MRTLIAMTQYMISVYHRDGAHDAGEVYGSEEEMQQAFAKVNAFNQKLQDAGDWVLAGGLVPPSQGLMAAPDGSVKDSGIESEYQLGGFWIIQASTPEIARSYAVEAAEACGNEVELRPLAG